MKKLILVALVAFAFGSQAQIQSPSPSSAGSVSSKIGMTDVTVDYSRPKMKGRKIFGEGADYLIPNGKIWRTGANNGTKITFSKDVEVEGVKVPAGSYLIFSWPGATDWTITFYKDLTIGGNTEGYDVKNEQAKFTVKSEKLAETIDTFTIGISDISEDNTMGKVQLTWENTSVKFKVNAPYGPQIESALNRDALTAAQYYFNTKKDAKTALKWINEYFADGKNADEFYNIYLKAQIQQAAGDKAGALATANQSLKLAKENKDGDFGYIKRDEDLIKSLTAK